MERFDPVATVAILAGLQTEARFQANHIRLDWAIRIALACARGTRRPSRGDLNELLNSGLEKARVLRLEDPIEGFFVEPVPTDQGDFLILAGAGQHAGPYTEAVYTAFSRLKDAEPKRQGLRWALAALRLSDALVNRCGLERRQIGSGTFQGKLGVPHEAALRAYPARMRFDHAALEALGLGLEDLTPFILPQDRWRDLLAAAPGDSILEFRPLVALDDGVLVAAPSALTTGARAILIDLAVEGGVEGDLQHHLIDVEGEAVVDSGFARIDRFPVSRAGRFLVREMGREVSPRRYVHYLHIMDDFKGWPDAAFGAPVDQPDMASLITARIKNVRGQLEAQDGFEEGLSVVFLGGWGGARSFALPNDTGAPNWEILLIPTADAAAIARCDGGTVRDLWRLQKQHSRVEHQGFRLATINGPLNLFHWWRLTEHQLVPPRSRDATPPITIDFGLDHVLEARREGFEALDHRALPYIDGTFKRVCRLDPKGYVGDLEPIYGSDDDLRAGRFVTAVAAGPLVFWLQLDTDRKDARGFDKYETLKAALNWAERTLPPFWHRYGADVTPRPTGAMLAVEWPDAPAERRLEDHEVAAAVVLETDTPLPRITLRPDWQWSLRRPDNIAEVELATRLLELVARQLGVTAARSELRDLVVKTAGSEHLRWRHSFLVSRAIDFMKHYGLIDRFRPIPVSAGALLKCGSAFIVRPRSEGLRIEGADACAAFLTAFAEAQLEILRRGVARFNKRAFITAAFEALQAALGEARSWEMTARAVRTIHGVGDDHRGSLERDVETNGVIRAVSMLIEIGSAEAAEADGAIVGDMDLAELQALALMVFMAADLVPGLKGGWVRPTVQISPTGEVMTDHGLIHDALMSSAERRHQRERARQSAAYETQFDPPARNRELPADLLAAISAEYLVDSDAVLDLPTATAHLAGARDEGVLVIRRSDLVATLEGEDAMQGKRLAPLVDRLTMPVRNGWNDLSGGFAPKDFDLSRFDRPASLIARPIIVVERGEDPVLAVAPAVIERCLFHNLGGAMQGTLQNEFWKSRAMRAFTGAAGARTGIEFNDEVAARVSQLGLTAWPSAKPAWALNTKATPEVEELGDVDVLAVSADGTRVWVIEVKDLKLCRTLGEVARRLAEYRGVTGAKGRPDKMLRHLRRVTYVREHAAALVGRLKLSAPPKVSGLVVVRAPQPMAHSQIGTVDGRVVMFEDLETVPWGAGWTG